MGIKYNNAKSYFTSECLLKINSMIPDAIMLMMKEAVSNFNICLTPLIKNDDKTYMVIALSVNLLNHLGIASQIFRSLVENFPMLPLSLFMSRLLMLQKNRLMPALNPAL
ncbi:hypothetical protein FZC77_20780 [Bacillus swezeyi]|uniref:Uncharacterized protein n=1 Tax=Bacillus swezeyi TaxID=1925020 RepID=A0A5M8RNK4_9BACI|nr:hypothetical protein DX927_17770 [Bacillus swezeyi]KAA6474436.1 hypothetical protein DX928_17940 [Bacillus swezeyi]TYS33736.1 hypothetical protein FZC77_20780 [Bacillus swezeyi]